MAALLLFATDRVAHADSPAGPSGDPLTLARALQLARAANPAIVASRHDLAAARSREQESQRRPAPVLGATWEDAGGGSATTGYDVTVALEQTVELGGDRAGRGALARAQREGALADLLMTRTAIDSEVAEAYFDAVEAQERVLVLIGAEQDAERAVQSAGERLRAGAAPAQEQLRARATGSQRRVERAEAERERQSACARLARTWQGDPRTIGRLSALDVEALEVPALDSLAILAARQPEARRARAVLALAEAEMQHLRAQRVPDVTLGVGLRRFAEPAATGWVATVAVPFAGPGTGRAAGAAAAEARAASTVRSNAWLTGSIASWHEQQDRLTSLRASLHELRTNGIPAADEALRAIEAGFRTGRFSYLDLQDSQRLRLEQRLLELQQLREISTTWWGLARLSAAGSDDLPVLPEVVR
jgi:cobalt-zinc-cadmium efflux system outer membrane protein